MPLGEADARRARRGTEPSTPITVASSSIPVSTWRREAPSVRSMPELADALGDRDRERVEDQEAAHQQRHAAEHEQHDPEEAEVVLDVLRLARRPPAVPVSTMHARRQHAVDAARAARRRTRRRAASTEIPSNSPSFSVSALRLGQRQLGGAGAAGGGVAEPLEADDPVALDRRPRRRSADVPPISRPSPVRGRLVDRRLVGGRAAGAPSM